MSTTTSFRQPAADAIFAEIELRCQRRQQLETALEQASSRRQKRKIKKMIRAEDRHMDGLEMECEALENTSDEEWAEIEF